MPDILVLYRNLVAIFKQKSIFIERYIQLTCSNKIKTSPIQMVFDTKLCISNKIKRDVSLPVMVNLKAMASSYSVIIE